MRTLNITLEDKHFNKLERAKDRYNQSKEEKDNWERFIMRLCDEFEEA
jgi:hypothetical protein